MGSRENIFCFYGKSVMEETLKNENVTTFPPRESLVSDIPAGDGNIANLFYTV